MNGSSVSSALKSRTSSTDFHQTCARKLTRKKSPALVKACRSSSLLPSLLDPRDLPNLKAVQKNGMEGKTLGSPSFSSTFPFGEESQDTLAHSSPLLILDILLVFNLDVLRNSILAARKGAAEKAKAPPRGPRMLNPPR